MRRGEEQQPALEPQTIRTLSRVSNAFPPCSPGAGCHWCACTDDTFALGATTSGPMLTEHSRRPGFSLGLRGVRALGFENASHFTLLVSQLSRTFCSGRELRACSRQWRQCKRRLCSRSVRKSSADEAARDYVGSRRWPCLCRRRACAALFLRMSAPVFRWARKGGSSR